MRRLLPGVLLLLGLLGAGLVVDVGTARPASAHATVTSSTPAADERLDTAPEAVTLTFDEDVSLSAGYARVLGPGGDRVDTDDATVVDQLLTVPLAGDLGEGSYVVTWRVVSADSHPVAGAYAFVVGDGTLVPASSTAGGSAGDPVVGAVEPVVRGLGYAGLALGLGVPVLLALCWPAGWSSSRARRLTSVGLAGVAGTAVLSFLVQGPYAAGRGLGGLFDAELLHATASSTFGATVLVRAVLALVLAAVLLPAWRGSPSRLLLGVAGLLGAGLVLATAAVGHPVAGSLSGLAVAVAAVHVLTMAVWLGGLAGLILVLVRPGTPEAELRSALPRFSRIAFVSVGALVASGVLQSVREIGTLGGLVSSTYGWLLLAKLAVVAVVLAAAAVSRVWVQHGLDAPRGTVVGRVTAQAFDASIDEPPEADTDVRPFRRSVLVELVGAVVVLGVSAVLVGTPPAAAGTPPPVDVTVPLQSSTSSTGNGTVEITVDPPRTGPTTLHLYLYDDAGTLVQPRDITVTLTEPARQIGPLPVDLLPGGPGHYTGDGTTFPTAGRWTVTVTVRLDEFTAVTASTVVPVT